MDQATHADPHDTDSHPRSDEAPHTKTARNGDEAKGFWAWWQRLNFLDFILATGTTLGTYGLIGLGFSTSYGAIRQIAKDKGHFTDSMSHVVPLSFEGGIIILSLYAIRAAREGKRALMLEVLVAIGSVATLYVNWQSKTDGIEGKLTHVVPVAMFLVCFKYLVHSTRKRALEAAGVLPPPLPRLRSVEWVLGPSDAFAQWKLMALRGIRTQEHAMWVHHAMQLRRVKMLEAHGVSRWRRVPLHERLEMRTRVLAEGEAIFASGDGDTGRYTLLTEKLATAEPVKPVEPVALPSQVAPRRELETLDEQTALPMGTATHTEPVPQAERPYTVIVSGEEDLTIMESGSERQAREQREESERDQRRQANYERAVEVVMELVRLGEPINAPRIAEDDRIPVGTRSVERYLKKMREEGLLPEEADA